MRIIGLTGGIASGKSTVSHRLAERHGATVLDADEAAIRIAEPGAPLWRLFVERYGREKALKADGTLDRARIGAVVFADDEERAWLDAVSHPIVRAELCKEIERCRARGDIKTVVLDVPLLYESGWDDIVDRVWVVYVRPETQLKRLMERNGLTEKLARDRIAAQMPLDEKKKRADVVIDNEGDIAGTNAAIDKAWEQEQCRQG